MDQLIDAAMTRAARRRLPRPRPGGLGRDAGPARAPGWVVARLVTETPTSYVLVADTLAEVHAQLPAGLVRARRQVAERDGPSARQGSQ